MLLVPKSVSEPINLVTQSSGLWRPLAETIHIQNSDQKSGLNLTVSQSTFAFSCHPSICYLSIFTCIYISKPVVCYSENTLLSFLHITISVVFSFLYQYISLSLVLRSHFFRRPFCPLNLLFVLLIVSWHSNGENKIGLSEPLGWNNYHNEFVWCTSLLVILIYLSI